MLVLKGILSAIIGVGIGFLASLAVALALWVVVGLSTWSSETGGRAANYAFLLIPIGAVVGFIIPFLEDADRRRTEEAERQLAAEKEQTARKAESKSLATLLDSSKATYSSLAQRVSTARVHLDRADFEFKERAFVPFWDEVEKAVNSLGAYHRDVSAVEHNATEYARRAAVLTYRGGSRVHRVSVPRFDMPKGGLPDARPVALRLTNVVRRAQRDFQFATIYEQRKTNQLIYAGFGTLASAIDRMQSSIGEALEDLSRSLNTSLGELLDASNAQRELLNELQDRSLEESKKQSEMLDNIQRHKKPLL